MLNNIWYDKIEPFRTTISDRIRLGLAIGTFGLLAPVLVSFRQEQALANSFFEERRQSNQLKINEKEERKELQPQKTNRYMFDIVLVFWTEYCHIYRNLGMRANLPQEMRLFPIGDVSSPLEMRIPRAHIHISRRRRRISRGICSAISKLPDM